MGRLKKYQTAEEKAKAKRLRANKYYWENKEKQDERARNYYRRKKNN